MLKLFVTTCLVMETNELAQKKPFYFLTKIPKLKIYKKSKRQPMFIIA